MAFTGCTETEREMPILGKTIQHLRKLKLNGRNKKTSALRADMRIKTVDFGKRIVAIVYIWLTR